MRTCIVMAHYDPRGLLRPDTLRLIAGLEAVADSIVLVSTSMLDTCRGLLPDRVNVISRENYGYDFYSYKVGIDALGNERYGSRLVLLNSSFVCLDVAKLISCFFRNAPDHVDIFGLTRSMELAPHLQSFLLSFSPECASSEKFARWWSRLAPINDRESVIRSYELGLSAHFSAEGFTLGCAFEPTMSERAIALWRSLRRMRPVLRPSALNPTHFHWDALLRRFGIVKMELLLKDPFRLMPDDVRNAIMKQAQLG